MTWSGLPTTAIFWLLPLTIPQGTFARAFASRHRIFSLSESNPVRLLQDHSHYVQGVAWDPLGEYFCSQSCDKSVCIYKFVSAVASATAKKETALPSFTLMCRKLAYQPPKQKSASTDNALAGEKPWKMYHNEDLPSFFRRPAWTPDGALLFTPAGLFKSPSQPTENTVYIYTRGSLSGYAFFLLDRPPDHQRLVCKGSKNPRSLFACVQYRLRCASPRQNPCLLCRTGGFTPLPR